jgi:hypothetical protein
MDPITAGLITNVVGSAFKPKAQYNPMMQHQMAAMNAKKSYIPYFNDLIKQGSGLQKSYMPKAQKMADMSIENAVKPLSDTDLFKGIGPMAAVLQRQGDAVTSNAANIGSQRGLYNPMGGWLGSGMDPNAGTNAAIAAAGAQFANQYELGKQDRLNNAFGIANNMAGQGTNMMQGGINGAQGAWSDFGQEAGNIGAQQLQAQQAANAQHAQLMNMLGTYWGNQYANNQFNKQLGLQREANAIAKAAAGNSSTPASNGGVKVGAYGGS